MGRKSIDKKESPSQSVSNIDYDKLADAVYKANMRSMAEMKKSKVEKVKITKHNRWWYFLISTLLVIFGCASLTIVITIIYNFDLYINILKIADWQGDNFYSNILFCCVGILLIAFFSTTSIFCFCSAKEIKKSKDKTFASTIFSCVAGLAAIVIALIALLVEVKK